MMCEGQEIVAENQLLRVKSFFFFVGSHKTLPSLLRVQDGFTNILAPNGSGTMEHVTSVR